MSTEQRASSGERAPLHRDTHTWPEPGAVRFRLEVVDVDGELAHRFAPSLPVEVTLIASEQPIDAPGGQGRRIIVVPLAFPNFPIARTHAEGLQSALGALERALERAAAAASSPIPAVDDGHRHVVRFERYARSLPFAASCEVCMAELVPNVHKWAVERGLLERGKLAYGPPGSSIRLEIEKTVNQDG